MKTYLFTILSYDNYGSLLQAYATNNYINDNHSECVLMDYKPVFERGAVNNPLKRVIKNMLLFIKKRKNRKFIETHTTLGFPTFSNLDELNDVIFEEESNFVVGSDQVWNANLTEGIDRVFFLDFQKTAKKFSFSSSFGSSTIEDKYSKEIALLLKDFNSISVREESGGKLLLGLGIDDYTVTLDPVFLLNSRQYFEISRKKAKIKKPYILIYSFEYSTLIEEKAMILSTNMGYSVYEIVITLPKYRKFKSLYNVDVHEFLYLFRNAEIIITSSFHGTSFSLIFEKDFYVKMPTQRATRITNLLGIVKLEDRIMSDVNISQHSNIDYREARKRLDKEILSQKRYLAKVFNDES